MIQKKVCMVGTSGVGKTSLVAKSVHRIFSDKYLTTVGVKIDKKTVAVDGNEVMLMIWPARLPWTRQSKFRAG